MENVYSILTVIFYDMAWTMKRNFIVIKVSRLLILYILNVRLIFYGMCDILVVKNPISYNWVSRKFLLKFKGIFLVK